jgi:hypothetical protein
MADHLLYKYVVPRKSFWEKSEIKPGPGINPQPIWYVVQILPNGMVEVQTSFYFPRRRHGDYKVVDPNDISEFIVRLYDDTPTDGALGDPSEGRVGVVVEASDDPDGEFFWIEDKLSGMKSLYTIYDFEILDLNTIKERARELRNLKLVSKDGFLPHSVPKNIESLVLRDLTGNPKMHNIQKEINTLKDLITGPKHIYNIALKKGPLPHGPTEKNFMGGKRSGPKRSDRNKRKSRGNLGTQMARRGTRRSSRGIFSRLYSPIGHLFSAGKESVGAVTNTAKGVVGEGIHGLDKIGRSVSKHANMAVKDVFTRKGGKRRGSRKSRKSKHTTRRR